MTVEKNTIYLLDKNITSTIEQIINTYKELFQEDFDKVVGITEKKLSIFSQHSEHSKYLAECYKKLKAIDFEDVLLEPFFGILEKIYQHVSWDRTDAVTKLTIDKIQAQNYAKEELNLLERFFIHASVGKDAQKVVEELTNDSYLESPILEWQNTCINDLIEINQYIKEEANKGNKDLSFIVPKTINKFNSPTGNIFKLLVVLSLYNNSDAMGITKILSTSEKANKKFKAYNLFFDTYFIYKLFSYRNELKHCDNKKADFITFDNALNNFINDHLDESLVRVEAVNLTIKQANTAEEDKIVKDLLDELTIISQEQNDPLIQEKINQLKEMINNKEPIPWGTALLTTISPSEKLKSQKYFNNIKFLFTPNNNTF